MALLRECVAAWCRIPDIHSLFVTVDGSTEDAERVAEVVYEHTESVYRVGQRALDSRQHPDTWYAPETGERLGVAVSKNTGLELLMTVPHVEHLFLCDDDTWPRFPQSLTKHTELEQPHSMVCWGKHRFAQINPDLWIAEWTWPRGVLLYQTRAVVEKVGGMDERFGMGGHEHAEYSMRIHNAGLTPVPFLSPASYATRRAMGADALWHAEDMPRLGEARHEFARRKRAHTTISDTDRDWERINAIMAERQGSADFVPYAAQANGRASATLCSSNTSLGAEK